MLRRLYRWTLDQAERPGAPWALGVVSFAESSFFPIPPDAMLIPMCLAKPSRAFWYATICTVTSVLGGLVGYAIGHLLYDTVGVKLIELYGYGAQADNFRAAYAEWGHWVILLKGLTPIPYKIVTITSGFAAYDLFWFTVLSIITRGARFYAVALLLYVWGDWAREFIERRLELLTTLFAILLVGGFAAIYFLF
ncbi:MAG TPA: YqaA family protein [Xanthobacteraceae bacterium]|nr:YqaA family protein [Xanthobacteraceae bacterium]